MSACLRPALSATCSYLQKWVRERISCFTITNLDDLSKLVPEDWPNLAGTLLQEPDNAITKSEPDQLYTDLRPYCDAKSLLQDKWHLDVELYFEKDCDTWIAEGSGKCEDFDLDSCLHPQHNLVLLIRPLGNFPEAEFDLTPQQCELLS